MFHENIMRSFGLELQPPCPICNNDLIFSFEDCEHFAPPYCADCRAYFVDRIHLDKMDACFDQISEIHQDISSKVKIVITEEKHLKEIPQKSNSCGYFCGHFEQLQSPTYSTVMSESFESLHTADFLNKDIEVISFDTIDYDGFLLYHSHQHSLQLKLSTNDEELYRFRRNISSESYSEDLNLMAMVLAESKDSLNSFLKHTESEEHFYIIRHHDSGFGASKYEHSQTYDSLYAFVGAKRLERNPEMKSLEKSPLTGKKSLIYSCSFLEN